MLCLIVAAGKKNVFKVSLIYFADDVNVINHDGLEYMNLDQMPQYLDDPTEFVNGESTSILNAINHAENVAVKFLQDKDIVPNRSITAFLFTDGDEMNVSDEVIMDAANRLTAVPSTLATISFGEEANEALLEEISSESNMAQKNKFDNDELMHHFPNKNKLFIVGHDDGKLTSEKAKAIRNFVDTLSKTAERAGDTFNFE